jgi:hypothetical protein
MKRDTYIDSMTAASLRIVVVLIIALCLYLKFITGGWLTLIPGLALYPLVSIFHYRFHSQALHRPERTPLSFFMLITISHFFFVGAFLLQYDVGDDPDWLTITALLHDGPGSEGSQPPSWWPRFELTYMGMLGSTLINLCIFIPTFITWILMHKRHLHKRI